LDAVEQTKTSPAHAIYATNIEGEGCSLAKEGDTHAKIISAEAVLSWQHPQAPTQEVHVQTTSVELEAILGKQDAIKVVAPTHVVDVELDLKLGNLGNPNANTPKGVLLMQSQTRRQGRTSTQT